MKRFIALVLSLVMALSLCAPAWGATTVSNAADLRTALETGGDIAVSGTMDADGTFTVPFNSNRQTEYLIDAETVDSLTGGEYVLDDAANWGFTVVVDEGETLALSKMDITADSTWVMNMKNNGSLILSNINLVATDGAGVYAYGSTGTTTLDELNVNHESLTNPEAPWAATAVAASNGQTMVINSGTYVGSTYGLYIYNSGATVTINGGTFKAPVVLKADGNYSDGNAAVIGKIVVNDGDFNGEIEASNGNAQIVINGGNFANFAFDNAGWNTLGSLAITGGTFDADPTDYVPDDGWYTITEGDGTWTVTKAPVVAKIGEVEYKTLAEAVAAANDGDTIELLQSVQAPGVVIDSSKYPTKGLTIDLNGFTYDVVAPTVGSSGTETNAFQLLKGGKITFKDGTITSSVAKILIQNYSGLTLLNVNVDGTKLQAPKYALSNNNGDVLITGNTSITAAADGVAFDVYRRSGYAGPSVTVDTTGTITGKVEIATSSSYPPADTNTAELKIKNGNFVGEITKDTASGDKATVAITGGTFSADPKAYVVDGYKAVEGNGVYTVMKTYNVTFDANGGKGEYTLAPVVEGKLVLPANPFTAPVGKQFKAWSVDGAEYAAGEKITVATDMTVTAVWEYIPVVEPDVEEEEVEPTVEVLAPEVSVNTEGMTETEKTAANAVAETLKEGNAVEISSSALTSEANEVAQDVAENTETIVTEEHVAALDSLTQNATVTADDVVVTVQTYFDVQVADVVLKEDSSEVETVTLEITPMYQLVATTEAVVNDDNTEIKTEGEDKNAVKVGGPETMKLDKPTKISVVLPDAFKGKVVYITHVAEKGVVLYKANADANGKLTFMTKSGFSPFTFSLNETEIAATIEGGDDYADLKSALNYAGKGAVIEVKKSGEVVDITTACSFKLKLAEGVDEPTFNVAKGYTMSKWYVNGVYTYIVQNASAGGYAPSTTPEKVVTSADTFDAGIALYVGMSVMAAAGSAVVLKKRED